MNKHVTLLSLSLLFTALIRVSAQDPEIPLKNWPAPLYYQLSPSDPGTTGKDTELPSLAASDTKPQARAMADMTALLVFVGAVPCRVIDTRNAIAPLGGPIMLGGSTRTFPILSSSCGIPSSAKAYSFNVTVVPNGALQWLTMWPTGFQMPVVSTLNAYQGQVVANAAIVPSGTSGNVNVFVTNTTHVIIDINGYYMQPTALALATGSVSNPAITLGAGADTGIYSPSTGTVGVTTGGSNRLTVNSSGISVNGNVDLKGDITKEGQRLLHTVGTVLGVGPGVLSNPGGGVNTAVGVSVLNSLTSGANNTAVGHVAMLNATSASESTAIGAGALQNTVGGARNSALGYQALCNLQSSDNTASGYRAGFYLQGGSYNTMVGSHALTRAENSTGNVAIGYRSMETSVSGNNNTAIGTAAGGQLTTGADNVMIGHGAGWNATTGSANIHISTWGAQESNTIRIGHPGNQNRAFVQGIRGVTTAAPNGMAVLIDSNGQLGTDSSSRRVKTDIRDMGDTTGTLMALRPVSFHYKLHGPDSPLQFGLVAEEVAEVAPELTARNNEGEIESVFYHKVNAMLLNEVQKQHRLIESQQQMLNELRQRLERIESAARAGATGQ